MLNRSRSAHENKPKTVKTKEAKDFSKSEAELVDVVDALQHVISTIEKEMATNRTFLQKEIGSRNTNNATVVNDEAYHRADQRPVPLKLGTLTTVEDAHNNADDRRHAVAKITMMSKDRRDSIRH